jgi:shikimate dehydrogenase
MTDRYAVIGNPIGHSKSPLIHRAFAEQTGQDLEYSAIEAPVGGFAAAVDAFREQGARGLNITAPFKLDAFAYCTELRDRAKIAGAVNAMKFESDRTIGDNFDGVGLTNDIVGNLGCPMKGRRVLVLGAGGAVRGALVPFLGQQPAELVLANRTVERAEGLARDFQPHGSITAIGYPALAGGRFGPFDLVINGTSASLKGELPPIEPGIFTRTALAYELLYGKGLTPFLRLAQSAGVSRLADGVGMLVEQAAEAFEWWRGVRPDRAPMIKQLTVPLEAPRA